MILTRAVCLNCLSISTRTIGTKPYTEGERIFYNMIQGKFHSATGLHLFGMHLQVTLKTPLTFMASRTHWTEIKILTVLQLYEIDE